MMVVAIDGPAGAGKSSVTRKLAHEIGFQFLDTGAMYRGVTWAAMQQNVSLDDDAALQQIAETIQLEFSADQVLIDGQDVTDAIRKPEVTRNVVSIADSKAVRVLLVELQRRIAATGNFVCEGRDQGTVAFPDAFCKIFLTASPHHRALRRVEQMEAAGQYVDFDRVVADQERRDQQDRDREFGGLRQADDAIEINTDTHSIDEVVQLLAEIVQSKLAVLRSS